MSITKKITAFFIILFLTSLNQLQAQEVKKIGKYKDWEAMVVSEASGKVCFAQSSPILQAPKTNKRDAKLFVAFRPNESITNEVSVTPGYEFNKSNSVTAASGNKKFKFDIKEQGFAWIADNKIELKMIKQMRKGSRIMITGYNQKGSQTIDHYSLLGFTKAYNASRKACSYFNEIKKKKWPGKIVGDRKHNYFSDTKFFCIRDNFFSINLLPHICSVTNYFCIIIFLKPL